VLRAKASARILIAGQAPGTRVHQSGMPFTDPSGDRLREWMGVDSETFYDDTRIAIVPMGFCFPGLDAKGGDRPPRKECAPAWRKELLAHLDQVELTLLVGSYAQAWHLGAARKASLSETVNGFREYGPRFVPLPHPSWRNNAWLKKNPWFDEELLPHLRQRISAILKA
jgi:uracil-DNA glycosylase